MQRSSVVLPLPEGPMTVTTSPRGDVEVDRLQHLVGAEGLRQAAQCGRRQGSAIGVGHGLIP